MFTERIFSIGISKFQLGRMDNDLLSDQVRYYCTNPNSKSVDKKDMGLDNPNLQQLNEIVLNQSQQILDGMISNSNVTNVKCYLQKVWGNHNINEDICIPHTHRESFLSAVYYPKSTDGRIHFHSPWTDSILSQIPTLPAETYHEFNSTYYELHPRTGWLIFFPSNLIHFVPPSKDERISIVYDVGVLRH